jgi:hypothetical protein
MSTHPLKNAALACDAGANVHGIRDNSRSGRRMNLLLGVTILLACATSFSCAHASTCWHSGLSRISELPNNAAVGLLRTSTSDAT